MQYLRLKSVLLPLTIALPIFTAHAGDEMAKATLQDKLNEIQTRLAQLEHKEATATPQNKNTTVSLYGSLRPTFGVTSSDAQDNWDVGDALSRIGVAVNHQLSDGITGFAKGEFKVQIQGDAHFGDTRKAYVGIKGDFGRVAIGKQDTTHFAIIAGPVDIFNRANTPLAYDDVSLFRQQEMISYRKSFGNVEFRAEAQFKGDDALNAGSDLVNAGVKYQGDDYSLAVAYLSRDLAGVDENTLGVSASKNFGDWYIGAAYLDLKRNVIDADIQTFDLVVTYSINEQYKVLFGASKLNDELISSVSNDVTRLNTTLEWQGSKDFRLFVEYQNNNYSTQNEKDSDQLMVGMRYNFNYQF